MDTLIETECVVLETSLYKFFDEGPLIGDVIQFLGNHGFAVFDVWALQYRNDGTLLMIDLAFVKATGRFRKTHRFQPSASETR